MSGRIGSQLPLFANLDGRDRHGDTSSLDTPNSANTPTPNGPPALAMCVLGSGSGGNSSVIRCHGKSLLIDAGLGPVTIARRLKQARLSLAAVGAICLTHLDQDHFRPTWVATLLKSQVPVYLHRWHVAGLRRVPEGMRLWRAGVIRTFDDDPFVPLAGFALHPIRLAHDVKGTCGFRVQTAGGAVGYATDLGHVPANLIDHFAGVDVLAIESNYDPDMQRRSGRPIFLQRRIMGKLGHLSNQQSFDAVCAIIDRDVAPQHIVLLHRSQQCNCPTIVRQMFTQDTRIADRLTLAEQRTCSPWFNVAMQRGRGSGV